MTSFLDASAIVKHYADEPGSILVRTEAPDGVISDLSVVEVPSAIWRKHRVGDLSAYHAGLLAAAFVRDLRGSTTTALRYFSVATTVALLDRAAELIPRHGLKAGDAVQLASALAARDRVRDCQTFIGFDRRLREAAAVEGFSIFPTEQQLESL